MASINMLRFFSAGSILKSNDQFSFSVFPEIFHFPPKSARSLVLGRQMLGLTLVPSCFDPKIPNIGVIFVQA